MYVVEPALLLQLIGRRSLISICQERDTSARFLGPGNRKPTWLRLGRRQPAEISHQNPSEALFPRHGRTRESAGWHHYEHGSVIAFAGEAYRSVRRPARAVERRRLSSGEVVPHVGRALPSARGLNCLRIRRGRSLTGLGRAAQQSMAERNCLRE